MSIELNKISNNINFQIPDLKGVNSKEELVKTLELFNNKKSELVALQQKIQQALIEIEKKEKEAQVKIAELDKPKPTPIISTVATLGTGVLIINKNQIVKSKDGSGERENYKVTLLSKDNKEIEIGKDPIDTRKYGEIKQIIIRDGDQDTILDDNDTTKRIIKYMTATDFSAFRLELNKEVADHNKSYPNQNQRFDCQRFCYYVQHGREGEYNPWSSSYARTDAFKKKVLCISQGRFYKIDAYTANFGNEMADIVEMI